MVSQRPDGLLRVVATDDSPTLCSVLEFRAFPSIPNISQHFPAFPSIFQCISSALRMILRDWPSCHRVSLQISTEFNTDCGRTARHGCLFRPPFVNNSEECFLQAKCDCGLQIRNYSCMAQPFEYWWVHENRSIFL